MADTENDITEPSHFTCIWTIEDISSPCCIESPTFTVKEMEMTKWNLSVYCGIDFNRIAVYRGDDEGPESIEIKYELSLLGIEGLPLIKKVGSAMFQEGSSKNIEGFADEDEVFIRRRMEFLPRGALTVRCRMWRTGTEISKHELCFARTLSRRDPPSLVWEIREFSTLQGDWERKLVLSHSSKKELTFGLILGDIDGEEYVSVNIKDSGEESFGSCVATVGVLDFEGKVVHSQEAVLDSGFLIVNLLKKITLTDSKNSLLPNDVLSLACEIDMVDIIEWSVLESSVNVNSKSSVMTDATMILRGEEDKTPAVSSSFTEAIKSLLAEGTLSDVSLQTDSKSFPVHKCILSARSPVFKAMFSGDMREKTATSVPIPDVDNGTLGEMLSYIYTDTVGELEWQGAAELYRAAEKYELLDLKRKCATFLKSGLSVSSVCAVLGVADLHHDRELREAAQEFVLRQGDEFFTSAIWKSFKEKNSKLCVEILERIVSSKKTHSPPPKKFKSIQ